MLEQQKMQYLLIRKATQTPYCQSQLLVNISKKKGKPLDEKEMQDFRSIIVQISWTKSTKIQLSPELFVEILKLTPFLKSSQQGLLNSLQIIYYFWKAEFFLNLNSTISINFTTSNLEDLWWG